MHLSAMLAGMQLDVFINLKAAKQIGLTIPVRVLERANQVIRCATKTKRRLFDPPI
jgi:ABC-type uncharacterized transport system substrate-binding protein